ncbi:G-protein-signaling modulator 1 [Siniperca chuatsi]|uniref:G-protein-signaling modulator 1 n=1 Tax=Siniperca chuatsi TaxID=119488 RepID=UPI001CE045DE|nr:G-protein-signaling modulator 1 [Siniperca chuatsi]XP_044063703.1 G-protein-signaling modulator 1 [Siniperca chuatsi]XP_044063704.1 G-protein-signaling modulator 1 [Siniperca chuatsi]XP_044063705.1 G-protein-signaling modulator 1 [Siniperca chuatsi]
MSRLMDCTEIKVEMAEEGLLERLVITEEGDVTEGVIERGAASSSVVIAQSCSGESALKKEEEHTGDIASKMCLEEQSLEKQQANAEDDHIGEVVVNEKDKQEDDKPEKTENMNDGQNRGDRENEGQTLEMMRINEKHEKPSDTEDEKVTQNYPQVDIKRLNSSGQQPEGTKSQEEDPKKAHRLTPDFPEALYELLCTLQEGRRLNDQRCSFRLESGMRRRRCHSEPNTTKPANRVIFSSMTSLQKEEFFELVATTQARRLDDQRAQLERSQPPKPKGRSFRGSIKQLSFVKKPAPVPVPVPVPKEDLYNMILTTQAQGRLEDQRSRAPGPMDDDDFFSLLLRVQGGRMDEQRTELPCMLKT